MSFLTKLFRRGDRRRHAEEKRREVVEASRPDPRPPANPPSHFGTTRCDRCGVSFQYDTTRYPHKPKYYCDDCDRHYSGRIKDEFGGRRTGF